MSLDQSKGPLTAREEIVLCFFRGDSLVAIERKNGGDVIHRYMTEEPKWGDTIDLFDARRNDSLTKEIV